MLQNVKKLLSATDFARDEVSAYARDLILPETRAGLVWLSFLLLSLQFGIWVLEIQAGRGDAYFYTFAMLSLLSIHMAWSASQVKDTPSLHYLAMTYLVMYAMALVLVAHRAGNFDIAIMATAVMLIIAIPLVPWGLREASAVAILIYTLFTASAVAVKGKFDTQTLWTLQFLFVATSVIALALVARGIRIRKQDIETRYDLEQAQQRHERLSLTDPLTGAFNRRFLNREFKGRAARALARSEKLHFVLLDVDYFKHLNDNHGHHCGDDVLRQLVSILHENLSGDSAVIRLGGDEFAILFVGDDCRELITRCLRHLETDPAVLRVTGGRPVTVSAGFAVVVDESSRSLDDVYHQADADLYESKRDRGELPAVPDSAETYAS